MMPQEKLYRQIEAAGYRIEGWHSEVNARDSGPINVRATHQTTGQSHEVTVQTRGQAGELEALQGIACRIGLSDC